MKQQWFKKTNTGILVILFLASCYRPTLTLTTEGSQVQFLPQPEEYPQCLFIDDFRSMTLSARENSYQQALIKIKNRVAVYQGTHLKINSSDTDELVTTIIGEGYRCPLTKDGRIQDMTIRSTPPPTQ